jgi:hypothetical protein
MDHGERLDLFFFVLWNASYVPTSNYFRKLKKITGAIFDTENPPVAAREAS